MSSSHDQQPGIGYAPPPRWYQRKRFHRLLIFGAIAVLLVSSIEWGPPLVWRVQVLYWQYRCLDASVPPKDKWSAWNDLTEGPNSPPLFIGPMHNESGQRKLVYIGDGGNDLTAGMPNKLLGCVVEPGNLLQEPSIVYADKWLIETYMIGFLPAQIDPADASHLTLKTEHVDITVDVWLRGDKLVVEPREPALSASATSQPSP